MATTAPLSGASVAGTASVAASAMASMGIVGVQFKVDGINFGAGVTAAPHTASWKTTTIANGSLTLTGPARDTPGNSHLGRGRRDGGKRARPHWPVLR